MSAEQITVIMDILIGLMRLIITIGLVVVAFYYIPKNLKNLKQQNEEIKERLDLIEKKLKD